MGAEDRKIVRIWLEAERAGRSEEADRAFASLSSGLPRRQPSPRFAAHVMARIAPARVAWLAFGGARAATVMSLVTLGVVLGTWSSRSMFLAGVAIAQSCAWGLGQVATGGMVWIETVLTVWGSAAHAAAVLGRLLTTPGPALIVGLNLVVAAGACAALQRLLASQED
jgi:hypothetical protein